MPNPEWCRVVHGGLLASGSTAMFYRQETRRSFYAPKVLHGTNLSDVGIGPVIGLEVGITVQGIANNLQRSWRFDGEPPEAVLRDFGTIDWILGG
jgi:hypothetical protein